MNAFAHTAGWAHGVMAGALVLLILLEALLWPRRRGVAVGHLALFLSLVALSTALLPPDASGVAPCFLVDGYGRYLIVLELLSGVLAILLLIERARMEGEWYGEQYAFALGVVLGGMILAATTDLVLVAVAGAVWLVSLVGLGGMGRVERRPAEAVLKTVVPGAMSTALMLYGAVLVYAAAGTTRIHGLSWAADPAQGASGASAAAQLRFAQALILAAAAVALGVIPFHGLALGLGSSGRVPVVVLGGAVPRLAALAVLGRVLAVPGISGAWFDVLRAGGIMTALAGALLGMHQHRLSRWLACAGITDAGLSLAAMGAGTATATSAALVCMTASILGGVGAYAVLGCLDPGDPAQELEIGHVRGVALRHPLLGAALVLFVLALGGIPLTLGFVGRIGVLQIFLQAQTVGAAVVLSLAAALSAWVHLRLVGHLLAPGTSAGMLRLRIGAEGVAVVVIAALAVLGLGLWPGPLLTAAQSAAEAL